MKKIAIYARIHWAKANVLSEFGFKSVFSASFLSSGASEKVVGIESSGILTIKAIHTSNALK